MSFLKFSSQKWLFLGEYGEGALFLDVREFFVRPKSLICIKICFKDVITQQS